jgi:hypothetical protein
MRTCACSLHADELIDEAVTVDPHEPAIGEANARFGRLIGATILATSVLVVLSVVLSSTVPERPVVVLPATTESDTLLPTSFSVNGVPELPS